MSGIGIWREKKVAKSRMGAVTAYDRGINGGC